MVFNGVRNNYGINRTYNDILNHNRRLDKTFAKISSGFSLNHPSEDSAKFVFSENLRTKISDTVQATKNTENAISMIQTAESGLNQINRLLINMKRVLIHASNDAVIDSFSRLANQAEIDDSIQELDLILANLQFGKRFLYKNQSGVNATTSSSGFEFIKATEKTASSGVDGYELEVKQFPSRSFIVAQRALNEEELEEGGARFTFLTRDQKAEYITLPNQTIGSILDSINTVLDKSRLNIYATIDANNKFAFKSKDFGSKHDFSFITNRPDVFKSGVEKLEILINAELGFDAQGVLGGELFTADGLTISGKSGGRTEGIELKLNLPDEILPGTKFDQYGNPFNSELFAIYEQYDTEETSNTIGKLYVQNNSLSYHVGTGYKEVADFNLPELNSKTIARGVKNKSGISSLEQVTVQNFDSTQDSLLVVDEAINEITLLRGKIGSFQKNLLETNQIAVEEKFEEISSAESKIRDADIAKLTADMVQQELSQAVASDVLKNTNQRLSDVLRLFRSS